MIENKYNNCAKRLKHHYLILIKKKNTILCIGLEFKVGNIPYKHVEIHKNLHTNLKQKEEKEKNKKRKLQEK